MNCAKAADVAGDHVTGNAMHIPCVYEDPGLDEVVETLEMMQSEQVSLQQVLAAFLTQFGACAR